MDQPDRYGSLERRPGDPRFWFSNTPLEFSRREHEVFEILWDRRGRLVSKADVLRQIDPTGNEIADAAVEVYIHRLRRKIEGTGVAISTLRGFGYLLRVEGENVAQLSYRAMSLQRRMDIALLYPICLVMVLAAISAYYVAAHFSRVVHDHWLTDSVNSLAEAIAARPQRRTTRARRARACAHRVGCRGSHRGIGSSHRRAEPSAVPTMFRSLTDADDVVSVGGTRLFESRIDGERVRVASLNLPAARYGEPLTLLVAETVHKRTRTAREIAAAVLVPQLLLTALAIGLLLRAVRRTVRPLKVVAARLSAQSHSSLDPVPFTGAPVEVHPLIHALNDVLTRLKGIVDTKREMLATAAHNLRTPLAAALLHLERVRDGGPRAASRRSTTTQTALRRAAHAAHQVLSLAHAEANAADPSTFVAVDLCALAHQMGAELAPTAMEKGHSLSLEVPDKVVFAQGHYDLLLSAAMNLLDNAIKYTPRGGDIIVSVCDEDLAGIRITDNGPELCRRPCAVRAAMSASCAASIRAQRGRGRRARSFHRAGVASRHRGRLEIAPGPDGHGTSCDAGFPGGRALRRRAATEPCAGRRLRPPRPRQAERVQSRLRPPRRPSEAASWQAALDARHSSCST